MITLVSKDSSIVHKLATALGESTRDLLERDFNAIASEFLAVERAVEQIEIFILEVNRFYKTDFKNKKLLEIGAGVGTFLVVCREKYDIEAFGLEPSLDEFSPFCEISNALLEEYNLPKNIVVQACGEAIPFADESFDFIYSTNVLEHVSDPRKVIAESIRVLKPGGFLQFVIPNYFSLWEGHYGVLWPCITNKFLAKIYATLVRKNPKYIDTLQLISPPYLKKILRNYDKKIEILNWGREIFKKRLVKGDYSDWAALHNVRPFVKLMQKIKLSPLIADILNLCEMYTPIILTIRKNKI